MFTIAQIKEAHSRVKSGADFPTYIQDLIELGVKGYDTFKLKVEFPFLFQISNYTQLVYTFYTLFQ